MDIIRRLDLVAIKIATQYVEEVFRLWMTSNTIAIYCIYL